MTFRFRLSALSWWPVQYQQAVQSRLAHLARKYVFSQRKAEKLRSAVADVAGTTSSNLVKRQT